MTAAATDDTSTLPTLKEFFAPGGTLAQAGGSRFEHRPGQMQMALRVEAALVDHLHLLVEAGTGTGKTIAYLYPSLRFAHITGSRVIVSTGTKSLQEQLFFKDVPFLESIFGPLKICYLKGRSNYLCRQKLYDLKPANAAREEQADLSLIRRWEATTATGDRSELTELPETSTAWPKLDARTDGCTGKECPSYARCFVNQARKAASESDVVIINHHLYFTDLAIRLKNPEASILPAAQAVIFDEAHELEHIASDCFGVSFSNRRMADLLRDMWKAVRGTSSEEALTELAKEVLRRFDLLWGGLPGKPEPNRAVFESRSAFLDQYKTTYEAVLHSLQRLHQRLLDIETLDGVPALLNRLGNLYSELRYLFEGSDTNAVFWIERRQFGPNRLTTFLQATPVDVSAFLRESVFSNLNSVVLASATLAAHDGFSHVRRALGIEEATELLVPSLFDYPTQATLYVPQEMPDPRDPAWFGRAVHETTKLLEITGGRAFCLFTSYEAMHRMHEALKKTVRFPLLLHGLMSRTELLRAFRKTEGAVLLGTSSFWQGIDVQGEQLSCVIVDRLPFAVPSDPVLQARIRAIEAKGGSGFHEYEIPRAVIALKQGFGRLIRSTSDRGVLAMLDPRIQHPIYGKAFTGSLPPYHLATDLDDVRHFLQ